jgi:hypothetical protein
VSLTVCCRVPAPDATDPGQVTALGLLRSTWTMLRARLLAVLVLMSLQDAAIFACQRLADFVTNHGGSLTPRSRAMTTAIMIHHAEYATSEAGSCGFWWHCAPSEHAVYCETHSLQPRWRGWAGHTHGKPWGRCRGRLRTPRSAPSQEV